MSFFAAETVSPHLTRIILPCGVCVYLVQGTERCALLDTGFGIGDLKAYVDSLVRTPYFVLLSHGHMDHAGGAVQFDEVYLSQRDWSLVQWHCTLERRIYDVHHGPGGVPEGVTDGDLLPDRTVPYLPLHDGDRFDLGGVTVEAVPVPGHSAGMMVFLIPEDRIAIFGDACGEGTLLTQEALPDYEQALMQLKTQEDRFDTVLRNHGSFWSPKQILTDNLELAGDILAGRDAAFPAEMMGVKGHFGRLPSHPGKVGNIFYASAADATW